MKGCPRCGSELCWKRGFSRHGKQRHTCKNCNYTYTIEKMWKYSDEQKKEALRYHNEGIPFRVIERLLHISHNSVIRWVKEAAGQIKKIVSQPQKEEKCDILEIDELWHFVHKKKRNMDLARR